jgi:hypothetical protein
LALFACDSTPPERYSITGVIEKMTVINHPIYDVVYIEFDDGRKFEMYGTPYGLIKDRDIQIWYEAKSGSWYYKGAELVKEPSS